MNMYLPYKWPAGFMHRSVATPMMCMHSIHVAVCLQEKGWIKPEYDPRGWFHW